MCMEMCMKMCVELRSVFVIDIEVPSIALSTDVVRSANARVFHCHVPHEDEVNHCGTALVTSNRPALGFSFFVRDTET